MITGIVNSRLEATIPLLIHGPTGQQLIDWVIDTGFNGSLTLPLNVIARLGLVWRSRSTATLADGSVASFDIYEAIVTWDGAPRNVLVETADTDPLVGMGLLAGHELRVEVKLGGAVTVVPLP
jgi:clan AA aspartic protease